MWLSKGRSTRLKNEGMGLLNCKEKMLPVNLTGSIFHAEAE